MQPLETAKMVRRDASVLGSPRQHGGDCGQAVVSFSLSRRTGNRITPIQKVPTDAGVIKARDRHVTEHILCRSQHPAIFGLRTAGECLFEFSGTRVVAHQSVERPFEAEAQRIVRFSEARHELGRPRFTSQRPTSGSVIVIVPLCAISEYLGDLVDPFKMHAYHDAFSTPLVDLNLLRIEIPLKRSIVACNSCKSYRLPGKVGAESFPLA